MKIMSKFMIVGLSLCTAMVMAGGITTSNKAAVKNDLSGALDYANAIPMESKVPSGVMSVAPDNAEPAPSFAEPGFSPGSQGSGITDEKERSVPLPEINESDAAVVAPQEYGDTNHPFSTTRVDMDYYGEFSSNKYPYSASGKLYFINGTTTYVCSASLIQPGVLVTAAHCVAAFGEERFYSDFMYIPSYRNGKMPYGKWAARTAAGSAVVMTSYYDGTDDCTVAGVVCQNDVAVLVLRRKLDKSEVRYNVGERTGWLGYGYDGWGQVNFSVFGNNSVIQTTQLGYPVSHDNGWLMQRNDSTAYTNTAAQNNTIIGSRQTGGSSGGPWIANFGQIASLSHSVEVGDASDSNIVMGVTSWGYQDQKWKQQGASPFTSGNILQLKNAACSNFPVACN